MIENTDDKDILTLKLDECLKNCDLILKGIELAIVIFFSEKSKAVCLKLNKNDSAIDDIIFEFNQRLPVLKFENTNNLILGWFDDTRVRYLNSFMFFYRLL